MSLKRLQVNLTDEALSAIRKRAVFAGKKNAEIARELIESVLTAASGSGERVKLPSFPGGIEKSPDGDVDYRTILADMELSSLGPPTETKEDWSGPILLSLASSLAKVNFLLLKVLPHLDLPGITTNERQDWVKSSEREAEEIVKNLTSGGKK